MRTDNDLFKKLFTNAVNSSIILQKKTIDKNLLDLEKMAHNIAQVINNKGKLLICGNGGSAADSQHLAAELIVRLNKNFNREPIPAFSLVPDAICLTACANDYEFSVIFERSLKAIGRKGDALLLISTSGNSENLIKVAEYARKNDIETYALLGGDGGDLSQIVDISFVVNSEDTARIQEVHLIIEHTLAKYIETIYFKSK